MAVLVDWLLGFALFYPLFMAYLWMTGALYYYFRWERQQTDVPDLDVTPQVSIIVPCHNEQDNLVATVESLTAVTYPDFEVIAVNDGSSDSTGHLLDVLASKHDCLRVVHLATNQGKAMALRAGALVSSGEVLMCVDGDVILDKHALHWAMVHFNGSPRVGAVTGNPRVRTRSTLLGKIQVAEFSSLVGLIKRAQRVYGRVFTVSGAVSAFRRAALQRVGYWDLDMITEDIDISWKLQLDHWDVRFEPNMLCWLLMPETLKGLWHQRLRWAQGGVEVLRKNVGRMGSWRARRMWPVYLEFLLSVAWSYTMLGIFALWVLGQFVTLDTAFAIPSLLPGWSGVLLGFTCLLQFAISLRIDSRYETGLGKYYYWVVWYPFVYWIINVLTIAVGTPKALCKAKGTRATWVSPDRGLST